jgi:hypothetical protein
MHELFHTRCHIVTPFIAHLPVLAQHLLRLGGIEEGSTIRFRAVLGAARAGGCAPLKCQSRITACSRTMHGIRFASA